MYFCKNCGEPYLIEENSICDKCGVYRNCGNSFCHNCGNQLRAEDEVCPVCGVNARSYYAPNDSGFSDFTMKSQGMNNYNSVYSSYGVSNATSKSAVLAGIFAIFFGSWGVHNFYLGYTKKAVTQLVLTIVGYCLFCVGIGMILTFVTSVWGFIEAVMLFAGGIQVDGHGQELMR